MTELRTRRGIPGVALGVGLVACAVVAIPVIGNWSGVAAVARTAVRAAWLLPCLVALHLFQLLLSGIAWRKLLPAPVASWPVFYRLRVVREGIDSLLPVAQVGGEIVGARLLARRGVTAGLAGASVIVDVTIELFTQVAFLLLGLIALAAIAGRSARGLGVEALAGGLAVLIAFVLAQRFGLLRVLEVLLRGIARRWPAFGDMSLDGLHAAALALYRRPRALLRGAGLHLLAWMLGTLETWAVLTVLGLAPTPAQAFVVESLGMAARSAGFAIPAALGAQEGGFVLAALAVGLPAGPALALSLVKRVREVLVGLVGLALWRRETR